MQKEIKFKAWDDLNKLMIEDVFVRGQIVFKDAGNGDNRIIGSYPQVKLMQFIGMKDINGKEIYEGDIVDAKAGDLDKFKEKFCIRYDSYTGSYRGENSRIVTGLFGLSEWRLEIIGNYYQDASLLNYTYDKK